ncbi:glucose 1-dehydrogenase [Pseudonocardia ailaonensis]|uniref:Glucose 1-dehydrogenase n=1 Tax=Pseudonocardia ailaonensis TaxID=367279 RepID=A0ABN2N8W6_9PSEU
MAKDFLRDVLNSHIEGGSDPGYWWDEERIPLDSIDKRVTELMDLRGKKAVVVGGAGLNLGQACVHRLAGLGAEVAVADLEPAAAADFQRSAGRAPKKDAAGVAQDAAEKWSASAFPVYGDVTTWQGASDVIAECHERLGRIDILVVSAVDVVMGPFAEMTPEEIDRSVRGTLMIPVYCARAVLDYMIPQGGGRIINVGSTSAMTAMPGHIMYGTCKAGVNTFTNYLGKELAAQGVHVLGVNPGSMWGPDREFVPDSYLGLYARGRQAIQRYELPEEVANMVAFLATDAASCMAGTMVDMGGGQGI